MVWFGVNSFSKEQRRSLYDQSGFCHLSVVRTWYFELLCVLRTKPQSVQDMNIGLWNNTDIEHIIDVELLESQLY